MVVKLKAYRLANGYREEFSLPILQVSVYDFDGGVSFDEHYTREQIEILDGLYGVKYRDIYGLNSSGERTETKVIGWTNTDFLTTGWNNGLPAGTVGGLKMDRFNPVFPILANIDEEISVGDLLIDDTLQIVRQIESEEKYDLRVSRATFSLDESSALTSFLNKYWNPDGYNSSEYMIGVELEGYFWGFSDFDNINFDEVEKTYHFDAYDPIKWLQKNIWSQRIPSLGTGTANLYNFLEKTCSLFLSIGKTINIDVDANQNWNRDYVGGYYGSYNPHYYTLDEHLTIMDMIIELLKHYGATMYYDENGNFNFVTRNKKNITSYNEDNMLEELNKSFQRWHYMGILIIVQSFGTNWEYTGWALVWEQDGELKSISVNGGLSNIPKNFSYLDLRQELPDIVPIIYSLGDEGHMYRVFTPRTKEQVFADYRDLLKSQQLYETTLDGIDYKLYDTITINGKEYVINYIDIDYIQKTTQVRVYKSL